MDQLAKGSSFFQGWCQVRVLRRDHLKWLWKISSCLLEPRTREQGVGLQPNRSKQVGTKCSCCWYSHTTHLLSGEGSLPVSKTQRELASLKVQPASSAGQSFVRCPSLLSQVSGGSHLPRAPAQELGSVHVRGGRSRPPTGMHLQCTFH